MIERKDEILSEISKIEKQHNISILLAVESGSRAWGFASKDSDFDVRFLYVRPCDDYLTLFEKKDTIEIPISDLLDINGWDIKKALQLLIKSNGALLEWIHSHYVYYAKDNVIEKLQSLAMQAIKPISVFQHYLATVKKKWLQITDEQKITPKTYLYALRALLCAEYINEKKQFPSVLFQTVYQSQLANNPTVLNEIEAMIAEKQHQDEKFLIERNEILDDYIKNTLAVIAYDGVDEKKTINFDVFDSAFKYFIDNY